MIKPREDLDRGTIAAWAGIAATYVLVRWNLLKIPLERDEGAFGCIGQALWRGELPYRDVFDHKPPIVFHLYALALKVLPPTAAGMHLFLHIWNAATLLAVYGLARRVWGRRPPALWAAFFFAVASAAASVQGFSAMTEMFMLLPIAASAWAAWSAADADSPRAAALSGALGAAAFWTKHTGATDALFAAAALAVLAWKDRGPKAAARLAAAWAAGAAAFSAAVVMPYAAAGAWKDFFYCNFTHNFSYVGRAGAAAASAKTAANLLRFLVECAVLVGAAASGLAGRHLSKRARLFTGGFLLASLAGVFPGHAFPHYLAQIVPAFALAAGGGAAMWLGFLPERRRWWAALALAGAALAAPYRARPWYYRGPPDGVSRRLFPGQPFPESPVLAEYIASRTKAEDAVLIVGSEPQILFMARRRSPIPFIYMYPLIQDFPRHREFQAAAWERLSRSPPAMIVTVPLPASLPWDGRADLEFFRRVNDLMKSSYALEAVCPAGQKDPRMFTGGEEFELREKVDDDAVRIYRRRPA